ncbi:hypothetical protein IIA16_04330 [bacterium]|nr:hypothetical protein [bacterium]
MLGRPALALFLAAGALVALSALAPDSLPRTLMAAGVGLLGTLLLVGAAWALALLVRRSDS